jgi:hypothetical protein
MDTLLLVYNEDLLRTAKEIIQDGGSLQFGPQSSQVWEQNVSE